MAARVGRAALPSYAAAVADCRNHADADCEAALCAPGGKLEELLADTEAPVRPGCTPEAAEKLTFLLGLDDLVLRTAQACRKWAEDFVAVAYVDDPAGLTSEERTCQQLIGGRLARVSRRVVWA